MTVSAYHEIRLSMSTVMCNAMECYDAIHRVDVKIAARRTSNCHNSVKDEITIFRPFTFF